MRTTTKASSVWAGAWLDPVALAASLVMTDCRLGKPRNLLVIRNMLLNWNVLTKNLKISRRRLMLTHMECFSEGECNLFRFTEEGDLGPLFADLFSVLTTLLLPRPRNA